MAKASLFEELICKKTIKSILKMNKPTSLIDIPLIAIYKDILKCLKQPNISLID